MIYLIQYSTSVHGYLITRSELTGVISRARHFTNKPSSPSDRVHGAVIQTIQATHHVLTYRRYILQTTTATTSPPLPPRQSAPPRPLQVRYTYTYTHTHTFYLVLQKHFAVDLSDHQKEVCYVITWFWIKNDDKLYRAISCTAVTSAGSEELLQAS